MSAGGPEPPAPAARDRFAELFGSPPPRVAVAPGRVNLIGEHTDYNEGFALPMAIGRVAAVAFRPRSDGRLRVHAAAFAETREQELRALAAPGGPGWFAHVAGVAWALAREGLHVPGFDAVLDGDVPIGAGLSSSAALEVAVALALSDAAGVAWDPPRLARIAQRAENEYVGTRCGVLDPLVSAAARTGHALLLDCRSLEARPVPLPEAVRFVVMDTGVRRALAASAYNERRAACERAAAALRRLDPSLRALRDADDRLLDEARGQLSPEDHRRARHVVGENARPRALAAALEAHDLPQAGRLLNASHESLRTLYEVSCAELDGLTEIARAHPACHGARLTGAGFGGCALALVDADGSAAFCEEVASRYTARFGLPGRLEAVSAGAGARLLLADEAVGDLRTR